jgi:NAD(P)-dependent dehydrogenase (short-subunit alcohol dehydrogenase family)
MKSQPNLPSGWNTSRIPDQTGKRYLVTGGNSGLGLESAKALVAKGAHVTITARSAIKGALAMAETGAAEFIEMDLGDLASVREAATKVSEPYNVVFLNAGIMAVPFAKTVDGFESQLGVNHLGHFAFAGLIENFVTDRWVVTTSFAHRWGGFGNQTGSLMVTLNWLACSWLVRWNGVAFRVGLARFLWLPILDGQIPIYLSIQ